MLITRILCSILCKPPTPLLDIKSGKIRIDPKLLKGFKALVTVQDQAGRTPLQCAAYGGYITCMAVLMENNADPNIQDKEVKAYTNAPTRRSPERF